MTTIRKTKATTKAGKIRFLVNLYNKLYEGHAVALSQFMAVAYSKGGINLAAPDNWSVKSEFFSYARENGLELE